jgi:hypothetical protein
VVVVVVCVHKKIEMDLLPCALQRTNDYDGTAVTEALLGGTEVREK